MKLIAGLPLKSRTVKSVSYITLGDMSFRSLFLRSRAVPCLNSRMSISHWSYAPPVLVILGMPLAALYLASSCSTSSSPRRILRYFFSCTAFAERIAGLMAFKGLPSMLSRTSSSRRAMRGLISFSSLLETVSVLRLFMFMMLRGRSTSLLECRSRTERLGADSRLLKVVS